MGILTFSPAVYMWGPRFKCRYTPWTWASLTPAAALNVLKKRCPKKGCPEEGLPWRRAFDKLDQKENAAHEKKSGIWGGLSVCFVDSSTCLQLHTACSTTSCSQPFANFQCPSLKALKRVAWNSLNKCTHLALCKGWALCKGNGAHEGSEKRSRGWQQKSCQKECFPRCQPRQTGWGSGLLHQVHGCGCQLWFAAVEELASPTGRTSEGFV